MIFRCLLGITIILACTLVLTANDGEEKPAAKPIQKASTADEARARAKMLHEMVRGTLQIMHRGFFDEDNAHAIPSASLEDVFHEMGDSYDVKMKWLPFQVIAWRR